MYSLEEDYQLNPLSVLLQALLTSPRAWLGLSSSRLGLVRTDYLALPVGPAAGPSHQTGEAPEHGWACRAADLIEPSIQLLSSRCRPRSTSVESQRDLRPKRPTFRPTVQLSLSVLLQVLLTSLVGPPAWLGLSSSRLDRTNYQLNHVGATTGPTGGVSESGDPSSRLQHQPSNIPCWYCCQAAALAAGFILTSQPLPLLSPHVQASILQ